MKLSISAEIVDMLTLSTNAENALETVEVLLINVMVFSSVGILTLSPKAETALETVHKSNGIFSVDILKLLTNAEIGVETVKVLFINVMVFFMSTC